MQMHTAGFKAASLTSWTIWVPIYFPVLSWLFIGQTGENDKEVDKSVTPYWLICLLIMLMQLLSGL